MPTIDKRFLLKLVLVALALAGGLFGAHALQARRIPDALKQQADRAAESGKRDAAIHYLRQYLEFEPDDVDALDRLAKMLRERDPTYRGYTEFVFLSEKILRIDPERHDVRREVLIACLKMSRYSDAVAHAEVLLKPFPTEAALWQQLGAAQTGLNLLTEARRSYETAIAHAPDEMLGYQRLAQVIWKNQNKPLEAKAVVDRMVAALPQEPLAYFARARFDSFLADEAANRGQAANLDPAIRDLHRVLELDPENADASLLLAEILQKGRDVPAAHAILRDAAALYPRDLRLIRSLAWLELVRGNLPASLAVLEEGLKHSPDGFDLLVPLADLLVQQGDATRTAEIVKRLEARRAPAAQMKYLHARIAMRDELWDEAIQQLEVLRSETLNRPSLEAQLNLLLAACSQKIGDADGEEKAFKRVLGSDPANVAARVGLANAYSNQGRFDDAARELDSALQAPTAHSGVYSQYVRLRARKLRNAGGSAEDWRKLEQVVANGVSLFGAVTSDAILLRAEVACAQGKFAEAIHLLKGETARRPGDTRLWAALAETSAEAAGTPAGLAVIDEAQASAGDGPDIRLARARLYAREPGRLRPIEPLAERIDTWADADRLRLLYGLVEVFDQAGEQDNVVSTLRRLAQQRPTDTSLWLRLYQRASESGIPAVAAEARAAIAKIEGESGPAVLICDARGSTEAPRLVAAFGPSPNRADACLLLAKRKSESGDVPEALRLTERAFILEPTRYEPARAWIALLATVGADDRAAAFIARLANDPRWAGEPLRRMLAGMIERLPPALGMKVVAWCQPLVEREPGGLGWLAKCLTTVGQSGEADAALRAATAAPTATSDDWFRLMLSVAGRAGELEATVKAARGKLAPPIFFAVAAAFREVSSVKDWSPALATADDERAFAQARLAIKLSLSKHVEAAKILESFLAEADLRAVDAGWARRNLAMLYAIGGTPDDRKRAMDLVKLDEATGATPDELRATASVLTTLARYLEGDDRKSVLARAALTLNGAYQATQSPRDLYNLAQLHRVAGNRKASRECINALLKTDSQNLYYLTTALEELTQDRDYVGGEAFAERLRMRFKGEFRAVAATARFECRAGHPDRALALAEGYAGAADAGAGDYQTRAARVAELLDELARYPEVRGSATAHQMADAAVDRFAALVPTRSEAVVGIAGALAANGRVADAFAKIDLFSRYLPVRVRALAGLAALRSGGATDRQFALVRDWLDAALAEEPDSIPTRLAEAEFLALRQNYGKSAEAYRVILKRDARHIVALNNLAWVLAADPTTALEARDLIDRATREAGPTGELLDTRARVRITLKQFAQAERDLTDAMTQEATPLRWFHLALLRTTQLPPRPDEALKAFREATARGLDVKAIHPADLPAHRVLEAETQRMRN